MGAAAIYQHLLNKHGGVGTRPKSVSVGDSGSGGGKGAEERAPAGDDADTDADLVTTKPAKTAACDCGGAMGSCKVLVNEYADTFVGAELEDEARART